MNVRLMYELEFPAGIYFKDRLQINHYTVNLNLLTATTDADSITVAMDRIKWFVYGELENTVFVNQSMAERAELMSMMGINVTMLPEEPVDQIIGMMLYCKLNAITEGRMQITQIDISSSLGDSVWYMHDDEDSLGPFAADGWWHRAGCQRNDVVPAADQNVVKVTTDGWTEVGLDWPDEHEPVANTVVYANFPRNEN